MHANNNIHTNNVYQVHQNIQPNIQRNMHHDARQVVYYNGASPQKRVVIESQPHIQDLQSNIQHIQPKPNTQQVQSNVQNAKSNIHHDVHHIIKYN